jgi:hypothetical protein
MKQFFTVVIILQSLLFCGSSHAQPSKLDALFAGADTTAVIDSLLKDFDEYLDSLSQPGSFFNISAGAGTGFFSEKNSASSDILLNRKAVFSPQVSYYHRSGFGFAATGYLMYENGKLNPYQLTVSPSYDYFSPQNFTTGISFTRYFNKQDPSYYTTPIRNEIYTYFNYRRWWLAPGIAFNYGWGNKTEYNQQEVNSTFRRLHASGKNIIYIMQVESVKDLSVMFSLRHNFEWYKLRSNKDMLTVTPAVLLSGGTQNFGLNTSFSSNSKQINNSLLPVNINLSDREGFSFQSTAFLLRMNYSFEKFYISPLLLFDYYLHASDTRFNTLYSLSFGFNF